MCLFMSGGDIIISYIINFVNAKIIQKEFFDGVTLNLYSMNEKAIGIILTKNKPAGIL